MVELANKNLGMAMQQLPIGIFDSGIGGLTVLKALQQQLPHESFIYLGDTARLPYGTKSEQTVKSYTKRAYHFLQASGIKLLVIACNTASAFALSDYTTASTNIPVLGVIEPGASAACQLSKNGHIAVIGTEATIRYQAYHKAIQRLRPTASITSQSCSLLVALAEEGWVDDDITLAVGQRYLSPLFQSSQINMPDCLLLGCTHFPILKHSLQKIVGEQVSIVDSASTTAACVYQLLKHRQLLQTNKIPGRTSFFVTDLPERFIRVAKNFLKDNTTIEAVELVAF